MNILYINTSGSPDYQADAVYHGLKSLYGETVDSLSDMWYMYDPLLDRDRKALYGKGFTLYGNIPGRLQRVVTQEQALSRLREGYYAAVVYGSIRRSNELLTDVARYCSANKIAFIDGEDDACIAKEYLGMGTYFKRELVHNNKQPYVKPISFAIPENKIVTGIPRKDQEWAVNYPGRPYTYVFNEESGYYEDYRKSKYAVTCKKAGWDCLRHYEILANGCLPYFLDLESCPSGTLTTLPKALLKEIKGLIDSGEMTDEQYAGYVDQLLRYVRSTLTTERLARYVLGERSVVSSSAGRRAASIKPVHGGFLAPLERRGTVFVDTMHKSPQLLHVSARYSRIYVHDHMKSASFFIQRHYGNVSLVSPFERMASRVDEAVLEFNLPYQDRLTDYFIWLRGHLNTHAKVTVVVPNMFRWLVIRGLIRGELAGEDAYLSNKPVMNRFTPRQITRFLQSMGFGDITITGARYTGNWFVSKFLAWIPVIRLLYSKVLIIRCRMESGRLNDE